MDKLKGCLKRVEPNDYKTVTQKCPQFPQIPLKHIASNKGENFLQVGEYLIGIVQESRVKRTPTGKPKKEFVCMVQHCRKIYTKASHLRDHSRIHTGERPFLCSWADCSKSFTRSDELQRHFRTHTGERKYPCDRCDKKFSRSDHLKKHVNSHIRFERLTRKPNKLIPQRKQEKDIQALRSMVKEESEEIVDERNEDSICSAKSKVKLEFIENNNDTLPEISLLFPIVNIKEEPELVINP